MQTVPVTVTRANIKTNNLSPQQLANMRRKAADNIKAVARGAKHNVKPPSSVYGGTGNVIGYVKDIFPYFSPYTIAFLVERIYEYSYRENSGVIPGEGSIKNIARSYGLKVRDAVK